MYSASHTPDLNPQLFHIQTNKPFPLLPNLSTICIGKPNEQKLPDIDVSGLPDTDIVSRSHAQIWVTGNEYQITDLESSNGTYINGVRLQPKVFYPLQPGDRISLGQGDKVTFVFMVKSTATSSSQSYTSNSAPTKISPPITTKEEKEIALATKVMGLVLVLGGITFLTSSIYISFYLRSTPGIVLCLTGVIALNWQGQDHLKLGWILIGIGIALFISSGAIIGSVSLLSLLLSFVSISSGFQLFTTGKVFNFNPLQLQKLIKK